MKINAQLFLDHISKASIGGTINEIVLGSRMSFAATEDSKSVVSICKGIDIVDSVNGKIGILNLKSFSKVVKYAKGTLFTKGQDIEISMVDRNLHQYLVFKNEAENELTFLLCPPKLISTTVDNAEEVIEKVSAGEAVMVTLTPALISQINKAIQIIAPAKCVFVSEGGKVKLLIGNEVEHNAIVNLGATKGGGKFKIVVKPKFLSKVLSVLPSDKDTLVEIRDAMPLIFKTAEYTFLLASMEVR